MFLFNRIRQKRMELGLKERTLEAMFVSAGKPVSRGSIRNWEDGKTFPPADMLEYLAAVFNDDVANYFTNIDENGRPLREVVRLGSITKQEDPL